MTLRFGTLDAAAATLAAALLCAGAAVAQPAASGTPWSALTPMQRTALSQLERDWAGIDASRQQKWLEIAARYPNMSPDERQRMQQRMTEWARLSPRERGQARINFQEARQLSPSERKARWESYQALPDEQKRKLAERANPPRDGAAVKPNSVTNVDGAKSNIVRAPTAPAVPVRPVGPTVVQAGPGATTTLISRPPKPPLHQQAGVPKIAATPAFVDSATLLPKRGAQGAAVESGERVEWPEPVVEAPEPPASAASES